MTRSSRFILRSYSSDRASSSKSICTLLSEPRHIGQSVIGPAVGRRDTVAQVALGDRAGASRGSSGRQALDLLIGDMNRMDGRESGIEQSVLIEQLHWPKAMLLDTFIHLSRLLGDVHVHRHLIRTGVLNHFAQVIDRNSANAVRGNADPRAPIRSSGCDLGPQRLGIGDEIRHPRRDKTKLRWIGSAPVAGTNISRAQQSDSQSYLASGPQNLEREQIPIFVRNAAGAVMHIVKFADRGDASEQHLQERHARSGIQ